MVLNLITYWFVNETLRLHLRFFQAMRIQMLMKCKEYQWSVEGRSCVSNSNVNKTNEMEWILEVTVRRNFYQCSWNLRNCNVSWRRRLVCRTQMFVKLKEINRFLRIRWGDEATHVNNTNGISMFSWGGIFASNQNVNKTKGISMFPWGYVEKRDFMILFHDFKMLIKPKEFQCFLEAKDFWYVFMISKCQ